MMLRRVLAYGRGFSLVELLVSVAIMGVLAAVAMPLAQTTIRRQKEESLRTSLREIRRAIDAYKDAASAGEIALAVGQSGYPPTLALLAQGVPNAKVAGAPPLYFLRRVPRDPFNADPTKAAADTWGLRSFDSPPDHPRPGSDVYDVYSLNSESGLNGVPYAQW